MTDLTRRALLATSLGATASTALAGPLLAAETPDIAVVVKLIGIPWFNRYGQGVRRAAADLKVNAYQVGPTQADPAQQVKIIEDLMAKRVSAIAVVPDDANVLAPVLQRARAAGIVVVTQESPGQIGSQWDLETIDNRDFAISVFQKLADLTGGEGKFALIVGSLTVPLHNAWADIGLAYLKQHYPKLTLIANRYPVGENLQESYETAQQILQANPDIKGFVSFGSQGPIGIARALQQEGLPPGKVANVGNILPNQAAPYLKKGYISEGFLWDPADSGYGVVVLADRVLRGLPIDNGISIAGLGKGVVDDKTHVVRFAAARTFTAQNVSQYDF